jgi:hypothetical protein
MELPAVVVAEMSAIMHWHRPQDTRNIKGNSFPSKGFLRVASFFLFVSANPPVQSVEKKSTKKGTHGLTLPTTNQQPTILFHTQIQLNTPS